MDFDKSKVYTALNADELKTGSKVIVADTLGELKNCVTREVNIQKLKEIREDFWEYRFATCDENYALAYLLETPEEKKLKWTDLKLGDVVHKKGAFFKGIVTEIDENTESNTHVMIGGTWKDDIELELWEKVD